MKNFLMPKRAFYLMTIVFFALCSACQKKNETAPTDDPTKPADTTVITPPVTASCKLTRQSSSYYSGSPQVYDFEYAANGYPSKITHYSNGKLVMTETIQPDYMEFIEAGSNALSLNIKYDTKYLEKSPGSYYAGTGPTTVATAGVYTYDSKSRIASVRGGLAENGKLVDETSTTITFTYNDKNDVTDITYTYRNQVKRTFTATGFDDHVTAYNNIKKSWFLQNDFILFSTEQENIRYLFDRLSTHNLLGYVDHEADTPFLYAETYTYKYDDKGQPIQRNASTGEQGNPTSGYNESWEYECK